MSRRILLGAAAFVLWGSVAFAARPAAAPQARVQPATVVILAAEAKTPSTTLPEASYRHGDCTWLSEVATQAGWPLDTHRRLAKIAARESGCCPNVRGGDVVDGNCQVIGVREWNHRSDSGLLQINGVHWKQDHAQYHGLVCKRLGICSQQPLLSPLNNLRAGKLLYDVAGWSPWSTPSD